MPGKHRVGVDEAVLFLGNVGERLAIVAVSEDAYFKALEAAAAARWTSGRVYDAVIGHRALKPNADTIYTWNVKHLKGISPALAGCNHTIIQVIVRPRHRFG